MSGAITSEVRCRRTGRVRDLAIALQRDGVTGIVIDPAARMFHVTGLTRIAPMIATCQDAVPT